MVPPCTRESVSLSHGGQGESLVPPCTRESVSLSHGGQGESLVPPYTRGSVSLSHGGQGESMCLLIHAEASLSLTGARGVGRKPGASLYTRLSLSPHNIRRVGRHLTSETRVGECVDGRL